MRIDLVTLKVFISVFEDESLAKAAEREHLAPSAVSKRLTDLEHLLKVKLFDRKHAGMFPTAAGTALMHHARKVMWDISQLESEMFEYSKGLRGVIRIYANTSAMVHYLPGELSSFLSHHPLVRIDLEEATSPETLRAVEENNAEIGIFGDVLVAPNLTILPYREDPLVLLVPRGHALAGRTSVRFADTLKHEFVGTPNGSSIDTAMLRAASDLGLPLRLSIRTAGFDAVSHMVEAGLGIALIPELAAQSYTQTMGVNSVRLDEPWARRRLQICIRSQQTLSAAAAAFVEHLSNYQDAGT